MAFKRGVVWTCVIIRDNLLYSLTATDIQSLLDSLCTLLALNNLAVFKMIFAKRELAVCISMFCKGKYVYIEMPHPHSIMMLSV